MLAFLREFWHIYAIVIAILSLFAWGVHTEGLKREAMREYCAVRGAVLTGSFCVTTPGQTVFKPDGGV